MSGVRAGAVAGGADLAVEYRMAVPAAWQRFSTDPAVLRAQVRRWLLRRTAHLPRDRTAGWRREAEQQVVAVVEGPAARHALRLLVLAIEPAGVPVTATCLVSVLPHDLSTPQLREQWAERAGAGALASTVQRVGSGDVVVVVTDRSTPADLGDLGPVELVQQAARAVGAEAPADLGQGTAADLVRQGASARTVEVYLPVPDQARTLLLSCSTPLISMADPLTELFLALAGTVQWRGDDGGWR